MLLALFFACHPDKDSDSSPAPTDPEVTYTPGDCLDPLPDARCGTVTLPERRGSGSPRTVTLPVAVIPAASGEENIPLVLFNGGPGSSALDLAGLLRRGQVMASLAETHDIVLFSERGTRGAIPELDCPELSQVDALFTETPDVRNAATLEAYTACRARLVAEDIDLSAFTNDARAADVPDLLHALGYTQWHLWGVSGGAVLVQRVLRDFPEGVVTAHADSGGFPTAHMRPIVFDLIANAADRYQRMFDTCAADPACNAAYPTLEADLWDLYATLEASPLPRTLTHPTTGETGEILLDGDLFLLVTTNAFSYVAYIPQAIEAARAGDFSSIESLLPYAFAVDTGTSFADGLYASVFCTDIGPARLDEVDVEGVQEALATAMFPQVESLFDICAIWDVPAIPEEGVVESDVHTLFMEGMFDANRRPENGRIAAEGYSSATVAEFPDHAHVVLDACAVGLMAQVMENPQATPDLGCIAEGVGYVVP